MDTPQYFEQLPGHAHYRPEGEFTILKAIELLAETIAYARAQQIRKLLMNATLLTGFDAPTTLERFHLGVEFAGAALSAVQVAVVAKPEWIDPDRFGLTVAQNRGMHADVFTDEAEALAWLLDLPAADARSKGD